MIIKFNNNEAIYAMTGISKTIEVTCTPELGKKYFNGETYLSNLESNADVLLEKCINSIQDEHIVCICLACSICYLAEGFDQLIVDILDNPAEDFSERIADMNAKNGAIENPLIKFSYIPRMNNYDLFNQIINKLFQEEITSYTTIYTVYPKQTKSAKNLMVNSTKLISHSGSGDD